jgi:3'-phosphoadenosine 5'-phosphosulfate sulfotransferase (PAPS reductase)/FAD synthetase
VIAHTARQYGDADHVTIATSGGTDSTVAADVWARYGPEYGLAPDSITHINTGLAVPQSRLVAKVLADMHDLEFIEQGYRNRRDSVAVRVLGNGWCGGYGGSPATGGHGLEWANRKDKPMDEVYVNIDGFQVWVSGARKLESAKRMKNLPDAGLKEDRPRRAWASVIGGWTTGEKRRYIRERGLPVSESYLFLGYSGECVACAFDGSGLLTGVDLLCPELGHAIRTLTVWLYQRARRGEVDIDPKQLCWGWDPDGPPEGPDEPTEAQVMVGCDTETCADREQPNWILDLPAPQIVTRTDVERYWATGEVPDRFPLSA